MKRFVSLDKMSKKAQKEYYANRRKTWGSIDPATKSFSNGKAYNRKKERQRIDREFRDEFTVDFVFSA